MKILQAVSRGHIQRTELDKNPRLLKSQRNVIDDDDDRFLTSGRRFEKHEIRENFLKQSKSNFTGLRNGNENIIIITRARMFFFNPIIL